MTKTLWIAFGAAASLMAQPPAQADYFEKHIRPLIATKCAMCHNPKAKTSGLDMSTGDAFFAGGASGSLINIDTPDQSLILKALNYDGSLKMPPTGKLKPEEIARVREWIQMGAPWPGSGPKAAGAKPAATGGTRKHGTPLTDDDWKFWSFQPVRPQTKPAVKNTSWPRTAVDHFILAKMESQNVKPAGPASKLALLRRATYDLHGLPPSEKEIAGFLADTAPDAFAKVVDRLLASPRYGEKWGRHWLDVARYADSTGNDEDHRYPYAYRYRDYVIDAFNSDMPFNQFVQEQIAGDLLPASGGGELNKRGIVATGFLALGAKAIAQQDKDRMLYDVYDEQLDVTSKAFLGVTLSCSRCHDHKFDPFTQKDYYGIVGMFASTRSFEDARTHVSKLLFTPLVPKAEFDKYEAAQNQVANKGIDIEIAIEQERTRRQSANLDKLEAYMMAARRVRAGKSNAEAEAKARGLEKNIVEKWVKHFNESEVPRPWLDAFHKADDSAAPAEIAKLQETARKSLAAWTKKMDAFRPRQRKQIEEKNMLSEKPKYINEKDGFFRDVFTDAGPFGMSDRSVTTEAVEALRAGQKKMKEQVPPQPDMACAVREDKPVAQKVFNRGEYTAPGEDAPKTFPLILAGKDRPIITEGSGRRELAAWLASESNPLTARVMVNRVWSWHFGEGIVRTPDNFGKMGERPTHPELLDYLADSFTRNQWSVKRLHREIMLSSTYQLASSAGPEVFKADPENKLFSRFPRRRLLVEEVRDGVLSIAGKIDLAMGGTLQAGFGTDGENSSGRLSINPETQTRRSVYLPLRRANLPALLNLFDFGDATTPNGRRVVTNVAPQALFLMNSKFVSEQSAALAAELAADTPEARAGRLYLRILNRQASPAEVDSAQSYVAGFKAKFPKASDADAWQSMARILFASNEFIYID